MDTTPEIGGREQTTRGGRMLDYCIKPAVVTTRILHPFNSDTYKTPLESRVTPYGIQKLAPAPTPSTSAPVPEPANSVTIPTPQRSIIRHKRREGGDGDRGGEGRDGGGVGWGSKREEREKERRTSRGHLMHLVCTHASLVQVPVEES